MSSLPSVTGAGWGGDGPVCHDSKLLWAALTEDASCMVCVFDADARVLFANQAAGHFLGRPSGAMIGRLLGELVPPETARNAMQLVARAISTRDAVRSEGYYRGALIRATWRPIAGPEHARVMLVATPPGVAAQLPPPPPGTVRNAPPDSEAIAQLSKRELEVLALLGKGMSVPQVAEALHRSARTVESHRLSIGKKLRVRNRSELTRFAIRAGLVTPDLPDGGGAADDKGD